jgi:hypothetical protein
MQLRKAYAPINLVLEDNLTHKRSQELANVLSLIIKTLSENLTYWKFCHLTYG